MRSIILILLLLSSAGAHAYIGPGLGLGALGVLIGGVLAVLLALAGVVWYPLKRLMKKTKTGARRSGKSDAARNEEAKKYEVEQSNEA